MAVERLIAGDHTNRSISILGRRDVNIRFTFSPREVEIFNFDCVAVEAFGSQMCVNSGDEVGPLNRHTGYCLTEAVWL